MRCRVSRRSAIKDSEVHPKCTGQVTFSFPWGSVFKEQLKDGHLTSNCSGVEHEQIHPSFDTDSTAGVGSSHQMSHFDVCKQLTRSQTVVLHLTPNIRCLPLDWFAQKYRLNLSNNQRHILFSFWMYSVFIIPSRKHSIWDTCRPQLCCKKETVTVFVTGILHSGSHEFWNDDTSSQLPVESCHSWMILQTGVVKQLCRGQGWRVPPRGFGGSTICVHSSFHRSAQRMKQIFDGDASWNCFDEPDCWGSCQALCVQSPEWNQAKKKLTTVGHEIRLGRRSAETYESKSCLCNSDNLHRNRMLPRCYLTKFPLLS